jgi:hypothetical protein
MLYVEGWKVRLVVDNLTSVRLGKSPDNYIRLVTTRRSSADARVQPNQFGVSTFLTHQGYFDS